MVTEEVVFSLVPGVPSSWFVPVFSLFNLSDIVSMEPIIDPDLEGNITFDEADTKFNYDGGNLPTKFFKTAMIMVIEIGLKVITKFEGQDTVFSKQLVALKEPFLEFIGDGQAVLGENELDTEIEKRIKDKLVDTIEEVKDILFDSNSEIDSEIDSEFDPDFELPALEDEQAQVESAKAKLSKLVESSSIE